MERDGGVEHSRGTGGPNSDLPDEDSGHLTSDPPAAIGPLADADLPTRPLPQVTPDTAGLGKDTSNPQEADSKTAPPPPRDQHPPVPEGTPRDDTPKSGAGPVQAKPEPLSAAEARDAEDTVVDDTRGDESETDGGAPPPADATRPPAGALPHDAESGRDPSEASAPSPAEATRPLSASGVDETVDDAAGGGEEDTVLEVSPAVRREDVPRGGGVGSGWQDGPQDAGFGREASGASAPSPAEATRPLSASGADETVDDAAGDDEDLTVPDAGPGATPLPRDSEPQATGPLPATSSPADATEPLPAVVGGDPAGHGEEDGTETARDEAAVPASQPTDATRALPAAVPGDTAADAAGGDDDPTVTDPGVPSPHEDLTPPEDADPTVEDPPEAGTTAVESTREDDDTTVPDADPTAVDDAPQAAAGIDEVCAELTAAYEELERRLRARDTKAVGWRGRLAALRAMRERQVTGDPDELARLLLHAEPSDVIRDEDVGEVVQRLLAERERILVLAPTDERAREIVQGLDDDVYALLVGGEEGPVVAGRPLREMGSHGTVEFKPIKPQRPPEPAPDPAAEAEPPEFEAVEARLQGVVVRPVGEAWRQAWVTEARMLQRGLVWLEQWPRDRAALEALEDARRRRREELDAELAGLAARIEEIRAAVEQAEQAGAEAAAEAERLEGEQATIAAELAGPRAEAQRLQADADAAAEEAGRLTRTAEATRARCEALDQRDRQARAELQAAQQQEQALTADLGRARDDLPRAVEEAERLMSESAAADAEGHTKYYRLAAAESALAARRRKLSLGQRLHVAPLPPELKDLRAEVKALGREADRAAERAAEAKRAAEQAQTYRTQLEAFINEGGARLAQAQEAQRALAAELARLAPEREAAAADHRQKAQLAGEAVQRATQARALAVEAQRVAQEIEGRLTAARQAHETAVAARDRANAEAEAARTAVAETEARLERRRTEAEEELSTRSAEYEAAKEAEARSRENVQEICGGEAIDEALLATHQSRAMARIEQLSHYLEHAETGHAASDEAAEVLLRTADLVCGTPATVGAAAGDAEFDVLLVAGAEAFTEADFLVGAVRTRRWVLVGHDGDTPPAYSEYTDMPRLTRSPFAAHAQP